MKVLYFSFVELDVPNACRAHTLGVLRGLGRLNCRVDALAPKPVRALKQIPHVRFFHLWPWQFSRPGRVWIKFLSALLMFLLCLKGKYDFIYVRELEVHPGPRFCSRFFHIPLYIEVNDLIVPVLSEQGAPSALLAQVAHNQELDFKQASGLIVPSVPMCDWIGNRYGVPARKIHLVLNGMEMPAADRLDRSASRKKLGLDATCYCLGFLGNIYDRYDFSTLLKAMLESGSRIPDLRLVVVGDGPMRREVEAKAAGMGLANETLFTGYVRPEKLGKILPAMDVGLLLLRKEEALRYGPVTTKFATYAGHRIPVIAAGSSTKGYPEEVVEGLLLTPPENHHALADIIYRLYRHPEESRKRAEILYRYAHEKLTWEHTAKEILDIVASDRREKI